MKNLATLLFGILLMSLSTTTVSANSQDYIVTGNYGKSYIFVENNVEFSVFPDGQFDFVYVGNTGSAVSVSIGSPNVNVSFNSGHDYDMYVQYDDYGAVLQVEDIAIYYDEYGRIIQAGSVDIRYHNRRLVSVGGLYLHYNRRGYYTHYTGYINHWNQYYVYRPWHVYYARPFYASCIVYDYAYRSYYTPTRYSYHYHRDNYSYRGRSNSYVNGRRNFYRPGARVHHRDGRVVKNRDYSPSRRVKAASASVRKSQNIAGSNNVVSKRSNKKDQAVAQRGAPNKGDRGNVTRPVTKRAKATTRPVGQRTKPTTRPVSKRTETYTKHKSSKRVATKSRPVSTQKRTVSKSSGNKIKRSTTSRPSTRKTIAKRSTNARPKTTSRPSSGRSKRKVSKKGRG